MSTSWTRFVSRRGHPGFNVDEILLHLWFRKVKVKRRLILQVTLD